MLRASPTSTRPLLHRIGGTQRRAVASRVSNSEHWAPYVKDPKAMQAQHTIDRRALAGIVVVLSVGYLLGTTATAPGESLVPAPVSAAWSWLFPPTYELREGEQFQTRWNKGGL